MTNEYQIRMAKAPQCDVDSLLDFLETLEEKTDSYDTSDEELGEWVNANFHRIYGKYKRILFGFSTLVDNVCDPSLDYLDYTPDIKQAKQQNEFLRQIIRGDRTLSDEDIDSMFSDWLKNSEMNV